MLSYVEVAVVVTDQAANCHQIDLCFRSMVALSRGTICCGFFLAKAYINTVAIRRT